MPSNTHLIQPNPFAPNPASTSVQSPGALRRIWREVKKIPPIGPVWGALRSEYFRLCTFRQRVSYLPYHRKIRRQQWTKLQVGAGYNPLPGWLNTDLRPQQEVLAVDATRAFPFRDAAFHYVFSEHMIEHVSFEQARQMLLEIHRVLADGGRLRLSTPDFDFFLRMFGEEVSAEEKQFVGWHVRTYNPRLPVHPLSVMNSMFRLWGHKHLYNEETLSLLLQECGFGQIKRFRTGESDDPHLQGLESHGKLVGEEHNRMETLVLEAVKLSVSTPHQKTT